MEEKREVNKVMLPLQISLAWTENLKRKPLAHKETRFGPTGPRDTGEGHPQGGTFFDFQNPAIHHLAVTSQGKTHSLTHF